MPDTPPRPWIAAGDGAAIRWVLSRPSRLSSWFFANRRPGGRSHSACRSFRRLESHRERATAECARSARGCATTDRGTRGRTRRARRFLHRKREKGARFFDTKAESEREVKG